jgi:hypothetical protein
MSSPGVLVRSTLLLRVPWATVLIAGTVAGLVTVLTQVQPAAAGSALTIRLVQLSLAAGAAYLLDDASAALTTTSPRTLWRHRAFPLAIGLGVTAASWSVVLLNLRRFPAAPVRELTLEVVVLVLLALTASAVLARQGEPEPGSVVAIGLPLAGVTVMLVGGMLGFEAFASSQVHGQDQRVVGWTALGAVALAVLAWAGRDEIP